MDYFPVFFWNDADDVTLGWVECGRFYRNALVIDYDLVAGPREAGGENVFRAPSMLLSTWGDAPGSSTWPTFEDKNYPIVGIFEIKNGEDYNFGLDIPNIKSLGIRTIAYAGQFPWAKSLAANPLLTPLNERTLWTGSDRGSGTSRGKLFEWKAWSAELKDLFDGYHASINVKDISR